MEGLDFLRYIDVCINSGEQVRLQYINTTPIGYMVKVFINNVDMGDIDLEASELIYYSLLLNEINN